jgi:redox-sensitive bicupin YhaK (pirin superfamily)
MAALRKIALAAKFVSEPDPRMFGNPANARGDANWSNQNWLKSIFSFSFAEYFDPRAARFGVLRVMNDDLVQPSRGFGSHGHRDMEICTYVVSGELTHKDSKGNAETLQRGAIQYMSAGTGVQHSEHNLNPTAPLRFIQCWVSPKLPSLPVNYGSYTPPDAQQRHNKWLHMVSDKDSKAATPIKISADCSFFASELDAGTALDFALAQGRQAYLLVVEGQVTAEIAACKDQLSQHDTAEVFGPGALRVTAGQAGAHLLLIEMNEDRKSSRFA